MDEVTVHLAREPDESVSIDAKHREQSIQHTVASDALEKILQQIRQLPPDAWDDLQRLDEIGQALRDQFLQPIYEKVFNRALGDKGRLLITSDRPEYLELPWELLPATEGGLLVGTGNWTILRCGRKALLPPAAGLSSPPLRILFCACAPTDLPPFPYEQEEESMVRLTNQLKGNARVEIAETGTLEEVCQRAAEFKPQIVHLAGHSSLQGRMGCFAFEDERGRSHLCSSSTIADKLFTRKGVRLLLVTGDYPSQEAAAALCDTLTATLHVPAALAWAARLSDESPLAFMGRFLHELIYGRSVESAVSEARRELAQSSTEGGASVRARQLPAWQSVFASEQEVNLVDRALTPDATVRPTVRYELLGDNIAGLRDGFVGRRRVLQRVLPALRHGEKRLFLLTGISGSGRSTLAARLATLLKEEGFSITGVQARPNDAWQFCLRLLGKLSVTCERLGLDEEKRILSDGHRQVNERLRLAVDILNRVKILLVLDNLEELLPPPPAPPAWIDPEFADFCRELMTRLTGQGRVIATCSQMPDGFDLKQPQIGLEALPEFSVTDFLKFARRHPEVTRLMETGRLSHELVTAFHRKLGITPRFVKQACAVLERVSAKSLAERLEAVPDGLSAEEQQAQFRDLFLSDLFRALPSEFRAGLSRLALIDLPLPIDGVARVSGLTRRKSEEAVEQWSSVGLIMELSGAAAVRLYGVHPLQRGFFLEPSRLPAPLAKAAHQEASAYFQECFDLNREDEFRWSITAELMACLKHATEAGDQERRKWAALRLSRRLQGKAEYRAALELIEPLVRGQELQPQE